MTLKILTAPSNLPTVSRTFSHSHEAEEEFQTFLLENHLKDGDMILKNWFVNMSGNMIADYVVVENGYHVRRHLSENVDIVRANYQWTYQTCLMHFWWGGDKKKRGKKKKK